MHAHKQIHDSYNNISRPCLLSSDFLLTSVCFDFQKNRHESILHSPDDNQDHPHKDYRYNSRQRPESNPDLNYLHHIEHFLNLNIKSSLPFNS